MTQMVTIEGSTTPSAELPRGERRTVVYTDRIARLVKRGFIVIVKGPTDVPDDLGQPQIAEGTGVPNIGHELPADGQLHDISLPGGTALAQIVVTGPGSAPLVPQHPNEIAQHNPAAEAAEAALHEHPTFAPTPAPVIDPALVEAGTVPKAPEPTESSTGG